VRAALPKRAALAAACGVDFRLPAYPRRPIRTKECAMSKGMDRKKETKKEPLKTPKEKKAEKAAKKTSK
jgi:hypothetical protein